MLWTAGCSSRSRQSGGTRSRSHSSLGHPGSVRPAARAGVPGCHSWGAPEPRGGCGVANRWLTRSGGNPQCSEAQRRQRGCSHQGKAATRRPAGAQVLHPHAAPESARPFAATGSGASCWRPTRHQASTWPSVLGTVSPSQAVSARQGQLARSPQAQTLAGSTATLRPGPRRACPAARAHLALVSGGCSARTRRHPGPAVRRSRVGHTAGMAGVDRSRRGTPWLPPAVDWVACRRRVHCEPPR